MKASIIPESNDSNLVNTFESCFKGYVDLLSKGEAVEITPDMGEGTTRLYIPSPTAEACRVYIDGQDDKPTIFLIHGWPDDLRLWNQFVCNFHSSYRCVRMCLPGYGPYADACPQWGYDLETLVHMVANTIIFALSGSKNGNKVILVTHDWGAALAWEVGYKYASLVDRIVGLDVSAFDNIWNPITIFYRLWLTLAFLLPITAVGNWMTRVNCYVFRAPANYNLVHKSMNYFYYWYWRDKFRGCCSCSSRRLDIAENNDDALLDIPILYIYGTGKPMVFHTRNWMRRLESGHRLNKVIELNCGHWIMKERTDQFHEMCLDFFSNSGSEEETSKEKLK